MDLLGVAELAELFEMSKRATLARTRGPDFPAPLSRLAAGPVWSRSQIVRYARQRCARFEERPAIERLAGEADPVPAARYGELVAARRESR